MIVKKHKRVKSVSNGIIDLFRLDLSKRTLRFLLNSYLLTYKLQKSYE